MKTSIFGLNFFQDLQSTDENFLKVNAKNDFCDMKCIQTKRSWSISLKDKLIYVL